jgi:hypothetical protein
MEGVEDGQGHEHALEGDAVAPQLRRETLGVVAAGQDVRVRARAVDAAGQRVRLVGGRRAGRGETRMRSRVNMVTGAEMEKSE